MFLLIDVKQRPVQTIRIARDAVVFRIVSAYWLSLLWYSKSL